MPAKKKPAGPTKATYDALSAAFDHFNKELFGNELPPVLLTLNRKRGALGYFWAEQARSRDGEVAHEIALNPEGMDRDVRTVLSTLVHEMAHHWQQVFGKPGKGAFHNMEWAEKMLELGLKPISIDKPGKMTGRRVTHEVVEGGAYDLSYEKFAKKGHDLSWFVTRPSKLARERDLSKVRTTCPCCGNTAWCKAGMRIVCGDCDEMMEQAV